ncbi:MAG: hypothetical protein N0E44_20080 [Candidatus Thiodiazotropha lotti]|nr:hypothetical protein [Candidatus Thiodiazotropha lotti]MCW4222176.1 hypothetical protein [Candidatus Thiodiazotropha lotti]
MRQLKRAVECGAMESEGFGGIERLSFAAGENEMSNVNVVSDDPKERLVKCRQLSEATETDWCLAEACRESLREHMRLLKDAQNRIAYLEDLRINEIVIGDRMVDSNGDARGTVLTSTHWDKRIQEAGLSGQWCQIIIRPVST